MTKVKELHKTWIKDAAYRREYDALEEEFTRAWLNRQGAPPGRPQPS